MRSNRLLVGCLINSVMKTLRLSKKLPQFCGGLSGQKSMGGKEYISSCVRRSETKENYGMVESNEKKGDDDRVQP